ncbi:A24 family peptidase [Hyphomicrobium sp. 99]|uniref:prepilin peptidase n=1 Tax=Hyphomicrobium sp. 99 TaxID=1163419 RepID=UPI000697CCED|nr:A24 family peptidase [Hyphomicrobium sp. 99]
MTSRQKFALIAALVALIGAVSFAVFSPDVALVSCLLGWSMLAIAATDAEHFIIPDILSLPAIPAGLLIAHGFGNGSSFGGEAVLMHLGAAVFGAAALYGIRELYRRWRGREGIGFGDVKLAGAAGAWTGYEGLGHVLLLSCGMAFLYVFLANVRNIRAIEGTTAIPFGVFLGPSIWLVWCAGVMAPGASTGL